MKSVGIIAWKLSNHLSFSKMGKMLGLQFHSVGHTITSRWSKLSFWVDDIEVKVQNSARNISTTQWYWKYKAFILPAVCGEMILDIFWNGQRWNKVCIRPTSKTLNTWYPQRVRRWSFKLWCSLVVFCFSINIYNNSKKDFDWFHSNVNRFNVLKLYLRFFLATKK